MVFIDKLLVRKLSNNWEKSNYFNNWQASPQLYNLYNNVTYERSIQQLIKTLRFPVFGHI